MYLATLACLVLIFIPSPGFCDASHDAVTNGYPPHVTPLNGDHSKGHHGNDSHGDHHGIHVAGWNLDYVKDPLIITLFLVVVAVCKLGFHHANFLSSIVPESCLLIILGTVIGAILQSADAKIVSLTPRMFFLFLLPPFSNVDRFAHLTSELFFLYLLPPIILESAYSLHDRVFFDNLGTILLFAVVGTVVNCFLIGPLLYGLALCGAMGSISITLIQCLVFSSLIVAVDPVAVLAIFQEIGVNNVLYFLVFGESLLNDAVTVVLYNMMKEFNEMDVIPVEQMFLGLASFFTISLLGLSIGIFFGIITAMLTRFTESVRVVEPLAVFALAYCAYLFAELFHFSGIISIIGCGLVQAQYSFHNISQKSLTTVTYFSKMLSATCDCIIFMFLGLALVHDQHQWHTGFIIWTNIICFIIRFLVVYALTFVANRMYRMRKIDWEEQFIMAYGGLRGAVAFCLVAMLNKDTLEHTNLFETTTLSVIIFTVFIQGITIKPLVKLLRIQRQGKETLSIYQEINLHVTDHVMAGIEEIMGKHGSNSIREIVDRFDDNYLKHWLQRSPMSKDDCIMEMYQQIALQLHYENLAGAADMQRYSSQMELYRPEVRSRKSTVSIDDGIPVGTYASEHANQVLDNFIHAHRMNKLRPKSELVPSPRRSPKSSIPGSPEPGARTSADQRPSSVSSPKAGWSAVKAVVAFKSSADKDQRAGSLEAADPVKRRSSVRRKTLINSLLGFPGEDEFKENPTAEDVRRWLVKNPSTNDYHQKFDRNLTRDDRTDLVHHLHEKQRRNARARRSSLAPAFMTFDSSEHLAVASNPGAGSHERLMMISEEEPQMSADGSRNGNHGRWQLPRAKTIDVSGMVEPSLTENKNEDLPDFERIPLLSAKSPCSDNATHNEDNKTTETNLEDGCHQQEPSHPHRGRLVRQEADAVPPVNVVANGESFTDDPKDHTDV